MAAPSALQNRKSADGYRSSAGGVPPSQTGDRPSAGKALPGTEEEALEEDQVEAREKLRHEWQGQPLPFLVDREAWRRYCVLVEVYEIYGGGASRVFLTSPFPRG